MTRSSEQAHYDLGVKAPYTWSARFETGGRMPKDAIVAELGSFVSRQAEVSRPLSGIILGAGASLRHTVILGLDPSRTYGTPSLEACEQMADGLQHELAWQREPDGSPYAMRMLMGLRPGYDDQAEAYTMSDLRQYITTQGVGNCLTIAGDVFSVRHIPDQGLRSYDEPGSAVYASAESLDDMLQTAHALGQARVVAEVFGEHTQVYQK